MPESTVSLQVYLDHSTQYATFCGQSENSGRLNNTFTPYILRNQRTSTTILQIRHKLGEEHGIPLEIQSHFSPGRGECNSQDGAAPSDLRDSDTVGEVCQHDQMKESLITVTLYTHAGYLAEMSDEQCYRSTVSAMKHWRYYANALSYFRRRLDGTEEGDTRNDLMRKVQEYEEFEKSWSAFTRKRLADWNIILYGSNHDDHDVQLLFTTFLEDCHRFGQRDTTQPCAVVSKPLRDRFDRLSPVSNSFSVSSGILLWGQLETVYAGSRNSEFQTNAEFIPKMLPGGTIKQYVHKYRSAARNGRWLVRRAYSDYGNLAQMGQPTSHFGWIICHESVDSLETLERCSRINITNAISNGNQHVDKDVLYVGRYDWSHHFNPRTLGGNLSSDLENLVQVATGSGGYQSSQYMLALDADGFCPSFLDCFKRLGLSISHPQEAIFYRPNEDHLSEAFGALVSLLQTEYEFGWLIFSGNKHANFPEADELVAIVYDGSYDGLEGCTFAVESDPQQPDNELMGFDESDFGDHLVTAIERNDKPMINAILATNNLETKLDARLYENALQAAVWLGNIEVVKILLEKDATSDGGLYSICLQTSAYMGHDIIMNMLLQRGAKVNAVCGQFGSALQAAAWTGRQNIVQILCDANADVNSMGGRFTHPLLAAVLGGNKDVVQLLLDYGAHPNAPCGSYGHALQAASLMGYVIIVDVLLGKGADVNAQGGQYGTALQAAAYSGQKDIILTLLARGADISAGQSGRVGECGSALHAAVYQGHKDIVRVLLHAGADLNAESGEYGNALHAAMCRRDKTMVELLLEAGANINTPCAYHGNTLDAAINLGLPQFVDLLINRGAWPSRPITTPDMNTRTLLRRRGVDVEFDNY